MAACITELRGTTQRAVPLDPSALSEADVATRTPKSKPDDGSDKKWEWLATDDPPTLEDEFEPPPADELELSAEPPDVPREEPEVPEHAPAQPLVPPKPAPPVSPEPAVEDVRGAWNPPPDG